MKNTKEYRAQLAEAFIHVLEDQQLNWKKGWQETPSGLSMPINAQSNRPYHGINRFYLSVVALKRGYQDPRWATFRQIQEKGWRLKDAKGQGVTVEYWFPYDRGEKKSITWEEFRKRNAQIGERYILIASYKVVFNGTLIEGIPKLAQIPVSEIQSAEVIHRISNNMQIKIFNDGGDRAYYSPKFDQIHLPRVVDFQSDYEYNATALHELAHASGAAHRLNRDMSGTFGTPAYAFEELVAEISSCFVSADLPIDQESFHIDNHKAYVQHWVSHIKEDPDVLIRAIQQAEKAAAYLEYQAELIKKEEYEKVNQSSKEIEVPGKENQMETKINVQLDPEIWSLEKMEENLILRYREKEMLRGTQKEIDSVVVRVQEAEAKGKELGEAISSVRKEKQQTKEELGNIVLLSEAELTAIEEGNLYPDPQTINILCNLYQISMSDLIDGKIMPKTTSRISGEEIEGTIHSIHDQLKVIQEDTRFFRDFMEKYDIQEKQQYVAQSRSLSESEQYVILNQESGEIVTNSKGEVRTWEGQEEAEHVALELNIAADAKESSIPQKLTKTAEIKQPAANIFRR